MVRPARLARIALLACMTLATQVGAVHGHDDGLTCHDHRTGGCAGGVKFQDSWEEQTIAVRIAGFIRLQVDEDGVSRIAVRGTVARQHDPTHDWAVLTIHYDGATVACSTAGLTRFDLLAEGPRTGERATLSIVPVRPIQEPGWHDVHFSLGFGVGVTEHDGAILVVSAADGPMP